jgi:hypothetical protein
MICCAAANSITLGCRCLSRAVVVVALVTWSLISHEVLVMIAFGDSITFRQLCCLGWLSGEAKFAHTTAHGRPTGELIIGL